ncbi:MAG: hypothetical protein R3176_00170 [Woeseiaceae bacterium]|nr:hypothetical protein [Woeseiaceae bacterium]
MKRLMPLALLLLLPASPASLADGHPLFESDEVLRAVLTGPLRQVYGQKRQEVRLYQPAQWSYVDENGETRRLEVSIRTRGNFRREYCNLPPLQLNFKKKQVKGTLFHGQDKLKLVAPCNHGARYQQYVILEYLAYRAFQLLTDDSYRTRLIRLTYFDSDEKLKPWTDFVFVIEDDADMARRLGFERLRVLDVDYDELDHSRTAIVQLFQFMIANNDYSVIAAGNDGFCCHNVDVLASVDEPTGVIPVPFDFDMSGLVNAAYAAPPDQVPILDVRQRYFYGLCQPDEVVEDAVEQIRARRGEILALFENSAELDDRSRTKSIGYIEDFYAILDNPARFAREVTARCRGSAHLERMLEAATD